LVRRDSEIGTKGFASEGSRPEAIGEKIGYYGRGIKAVPRPRRARLMAFKVRRSAKTIGLLVAFIAAIAVLSAAAMAPSAKNGRMPVPAGTSGTLPPIASFAVYGNDSGMVVTFDASASSDPDGTIVSYDWTFGDGGTGTGVNTTHTYASWGTWWVTLTVTDDDAMTDSTGLQVDVADHSGIPPQPYVVWGWLYDSGGAYITGVTITVTITDLRTGAVWIVDSNPDYGYYWLDDLNTNVTGWDFDDTIQVSASFGGVDGVNSGIVSASSLQLDITIDTVIPEFPVVIVPVLGMVAIAAVVGYKRRQDELLS
jgi:hypothetical protein